MKTAEEVLQERNKELICVTTETTIYESIRKMIENKVGAVLVMGKKEIKGIWTERDYLLDTMKKGFNPYTASVGEYMRTKMYYAKHDESIFQLMDKFVGLRIRHLPVKKEGELIGLLSSGDIQKELLNEKDNELKKMEKRLEWDYYEDWKW